MLTQSQTNILIFKVALIIRCLNAKKAPTQTNGST
ncbi:UNVERIFIED_ORG: hypothetical protein ABIC97_005365 [Peribacillus simplex]